MAQLFGSLIALLFLVILVSLGLAVFAEILRRLNKVFSIGLARLFGHWGENFVSKKLNQLNPQEYKVLNDMMLPSNGNTENTQIDHIVVSLFGIFCIETKDHGGWIFGNAKDKYWTQTFRRGQKFKLYNPLRQNFAHIKAIENIIKPSYPKLPIFSYVAFPHADRLIITGASNVGFTGDIIKGILSFTQQQISASEMEKIVGELNKLNIVDQSLRKQHIEEIRVIKSLQI